LVVAASEFGALNEACVRPRGGLCRVGGVEGRREAGEGERQARAVAGRCRRATATNAQQALEGGDPALDLYTLRPTPYTLHPTRNVPAVQGQGEPFRQPHILAPAANRFSTHLGSTHLGSTHLGSTHLGSTHLGSTHLGSTHLGSSTYPSPAAPETPPNSANSSKP